MWCVLSMMFATHLHAQTAQQEFSYTQYMDNLTPVNQAYSMLDKNGSINAIARKQYVGIQGSPGTFIFNGNLPIESINATAGVLVLSDQLAVEHNTQISAFFAKSLQVGEAQYLAVSLSVGVKNYVANFSSLDPSDPQFRNDVRETQPNLGFGVMYYGDNYYLGLSMPELTITALGTANVQDNLNFRNHYYMQGALITDVADDIKFKPATLISYTNGLPLTADVSGTFYLKELLGLGINYRTTKKAAGIISINMSSFKLGYSYEFGTASNNLGGLNTATSEITLSYRFGKNLQSKLL